MNKFFDMIDKFLGVVCAPKWRIIRNIICMALCLTSMLAVFLLMYNPICILPDGEFEINAADAFESMKSKDPAIHSFFMMQLAAFALIVVCMIAVAIYILKCLPKLKNEDEVADNTKSAIVFAIVFTAIYTIFTYLFSPINEMIGGLSMSKVEYGPLITMIVVAVLYGLLVGVPMAYRRNKEIENATVRHKIEIDRKKLRRKLFLQQLEMIVFTVAIAAIAMVTLMSDIISVSFAQTNANIPDLVISGAQVILGTAELNTAGERTIGYLVFLMFFLTMSFLLLSVVSFISRSTQVNKVAAASMIISSAACTLIGLFGEYYRVVQELNEDIVAKLLGDYSILAEDLLKYEITSSTFTYCYILVGVLCILFIRRPYSKANETYKKLSGFDDAIIAPSAEIKISTASIAMPDEDSGMTMAREEAPVSEPSTPAKRNDEFDPCPAFTELDAKIGIYSAELKKKREKLFVAPSLPNLVNYIVQYARDSKHHLFYTPESIATFLAGLGATRLTILQGMSGTGKTSLPKIVSEALMSVCDIVEVESSWRDKNELLGYYNEFNKTYTPKKFTQALYRACLNSDTLTFIVLDEMNLSRIEYYFSDFLSLMENDPDKREIKLLNVPLYKTEKGTRKRYAGLIDGHTIKIPPNVWFIGTANRDESTYDISDKVYDRAHTMNFDKRAQKPPFYNDPIPARYLPASELIRLFDEAKAAVKVDIDTYPVVKKAEALLEPYNISFGNRIAMQMESFVSIYASCFASNDQVIHDAIDTIMLSKVVKKLELKSVDDKETLAEEFGKIGLKRCSSFVLSLKED